jgi:ABC-type branched-subunit amino acid transport system ATPase component
LVEEKQMALLETHELTPSFGALRAVHGLTGTFPPSSGRIVFDGRDITRTKADRIAHLGLARS